MLERAAAQNGGDAAILYELADLTVELDGEPADALSLLEQVVCLDPAHAQAHLLLGDLVLDQGEGPRAIQHYERACNLAPPDSRIGREARRKLNKLRPPSPQRQAQGWGETLRRRRVTAPGSAGCSPGTRSRPSRARA
ncbi:MAG TPA: tetratricopeptide repeat protein [Anaerolineae bacterium]|nr:tetratricopeptide repeat protein [Anaerolineae bacterium]